MASATLVPVETYLRTAYRPDRDYVEGEVLERNMGEIPHSRLQGYFRDLFVLHQVDWGMEALPEVRVQVAKNSYRVPDVAVMHRGMEDTLIVQTPPALCIEIFSRDDRMGPMRDRVRDYRAMGVPVVWVIDPWRRVAYTGNEDGQLVPEETTLTIPESAVSIAVDDIFAELDRLGQRG